MDWNGKYEDTYEGNRSLEEDIMEAGATGKVRYPTETGGTVQEKDGRIDVFGESDSSRGHSHDWYDISTNQSGHHD